MKNIVKLTLLLIIVFLQNSYGQRTEKPKLIVGIIIDQMRSEYLYRFQDNYSENGFKRLIREGFNVKNMHYNYIPTATGPGHASVYTGTTPTSHGIVANDWYNRKLKRSVYCAEDSTVFLVDNKGIEKGAKYANFQRSPKNEQTTTISDELKLLTNGRSKVIGVSLKDRGAIFPVGHLANGAYWYNANNGHFITSSYYSSKLPKWVKDFNKKQQVDSLLSTTWAPLLSIEKYVNSEKDNVSFEKIFKDRKESTFPYDLSELRKKNGNYALITEVPQGNTLLTEFATAAIRGENLGKSDETDFLSISFSSTDYVGHHFGIRSKELEDTYVRIDRDIEKLLKLLDKEVGKGNYTLFLTADHAGSDNPQFLKSKKLPGKFYNSNKMKDEIEHHLSQKFGKESYIVYMSKTQVYFKDIKNNKEAIIKEAANFLKTIEGVKEVFTPVFSELNLSNSTKGNFIKNSFNKAESGDIFYVMQPGWMQLRSFGTTHATAYTSDTHVPLLWYGMNIPKGESVAYHSITQIAPTLSLLFNIPFPSASTLEPIKELFEK